MRTLKVIFAGFLVAALGPSAARATTTTHLTESGTGANIHAYFLSADGCIEIGVELDAATSITRGNGGTTGSGMGVSVFHNDYCTGYGIFEFGYTVVDLTNQFQTNNGNHTASLNVTVPLQTMDLDGVTRMRTVVANVQLQGSSDTTSGMSTSRSTYGGTRIVSSGRSVSNFATATGQVSVDGLQLLPAGSLVGTIETSMSVSVDITK